ncbi:metabolite traffic protein EboE [Streptomyces sp. NPDC005009]
MRLRHRDGTDVYVSYCTNVHAARDLTDIIRQLDRYARPVRERLGRTDLGLGLWLPYEAAAALDQDPALLHGLRRELEARGLFAATLNGFPYRDFHGTRVKKRVYRPDWADPRRLDYTLMLVRILAVLMPDDVTEGAVSTLPLGWRAGWGAAEDAAARAALDRLHTEIEDHTARTGRRVRVGLEPEPGCVVERSGDLAGLAGLGDTVGVCLDTCHLAVAFESPRRFLTALDEAGLGLVKLQAACAVEAARPAERATRNSLEALAEERYLHQVRTLGAAGVTGADDLPEAFDGLPADDPWRVHFHAPLHRERLGALRTTQHVLTDTLDAVLGGPRPLTRHIEVETYTWDVLPAAEPAAEDGLVPGIASELDWLVTRLQKTGLEELSYG